MEDSFELQYELTDYGKLLFDFDGNLNSMDMSEQRRKLMLRNPIFYYLNALAILLVIWFFESLIVNAIKLGFLQSLGLHLSGLFGLFVMCLILLLSAYGGWGKFIRWSSRGRLGGLKEFNAGEKEKEEVSWTKRNSIQVYEDWLVITNYGWTQVYYLSKVAEVRLQSAEITNKCYTATFISIDGKSVRASVKIPREKIILIQLRKIFGNKLKIQNVALSKKAVRRRNKSIGTLIGMTCFVSLAILVGVGIILLHYLLEVSVPVALGVFFIIGGLIGLCGVFDFVPILKDVMVPLLFGGFFLFFPISLIQIVINDSGGALTYKQFFGIFNVWGAGVLFFGGLGLYFVFLGIKTPIQYIRYRERKR